VATMMDDPNSILALYRNLLALRRSQAALSTGHIGPVRAEGDVLVFTRTRENDRLLVALNLGHRPQCVKLEPSTSYRLLLSTAGTALALHGGILRLEGDEGVILSC
jgi:alpha-glucosidase